LTPSPYLEAPHVQERSRHPAVGRACQAAAHQAPWHHRPCLDEDEASYARFCAFASDYDTFDLPDCKAVTPGLVKVSRQAEPKSIYSPAPSGPIRFERPKPRKIGDRNDRFCELPAEKRRRHVVTVVSASGQVAARVLVNPFTKRMKITQKGLP